MDRRHRALAATTGLFVVAASVVMLPSAGQAAFPGSNGAIAYTCIFEESRSEICVGNADGTNQRQLTTGQSFGNDHAAWSPDGTKIAFQRRQSGQCCLTDLYVMQANGNGVTQLTNTPTVGDTGPAWSPDGTKLVFSRDDGQSVQLHVLALATLATQPLAGTQGGSSPAWSPNGSQIAFSSLADGHEVCEVSTCFPLGEIYVVPAGGGTAANLSENNQTHDLFPNWSPAGNQILFERRPEPRDPISRVILMETGGEHDFFGVGDGNDPAFAPNGEIVAFEIGGDIHTSPPTQSAPPGQTPLSGLHPDWQPCKSTCPSTAAGDTSPSTTTLSAKRVGKKIKASGTLTPSHPGATVSVTLFKKKSGTFTVVKTTNATLSSTSTFAASFKRPGKGSCKVTASFAGDADHLASEATKSLKC